MTFPNPPKKKKEKIKYIQERQRVECIHTSPRWKGMRISVVCLCVSVVTPARKGKIWQILFRTISLPYIAALYIIFLDARKRTHTHITQARERRHFSMAFYRRRPRPGLKWNALYSACIPTDACHIFPQYVDSWRRSSSSSTSSFQASTSRTPQNGQRCHLRVYACFAHNRFGALFTLFSIYIKLYSWKKTCV